MLHELREKIGIAISSALEKTSVNAELAPLVVGH